MIVFNNIDKNFCIKNKKINKKWIYDVIKNEKKSLSFLSVNICSDKHLLKMNNEVLKHNYYTDIITFDLSDNKETVEGDLYISIDRVKENAIVNKIKVNDELSRVIVHGILHLCGYNDKTIEEKKEMTEKENYYLQLKQFHVEQNVR